LLANNGVGHTLWLPSLFYLYLVSAALAFYSPREVLVVVGVCVIFCTVGRSELLLQLQRTVLVGGSIACAFAVTRMRLQRRLEQLSAAAGAAQAEAKLAREDERQRIASDFHDGPLQSFISLQMRLEIVRKLLERDLKAGSGELQQSTGTGAVTGPGVACLSAQHAARGTGRRQPFDRGATGRRQFPKEAASR
jgi:signal transduction histidine kinase